MGQGEKAPDGQQHHPRQLKGEAQGGPGQEGLGIAAVKVPVLPGGEHRQNHHHRHRHQGDGPEAGGAGDGQAGANLKPVGQVNPPHQQADDAAGHRQGGEQDRFPHETGLPSEKTAGNGVPCQ